MCVKRFVNQMGIYVVDFGDNKNNIQGGKRPAVVVQQCIGNQFSPTTIVLPITSADKNQIPTHFILKKTDYPFFETDNSVVLCEQITTVNVGKQVHKYLGKVKKEHKAKLFLTLLKNFSYANMATNDIDFLI